VVAVVIVAAVAASAIATGNKTEKGAATTIICNVGYGKGVTNG
jgi:hypothetical protein